MDCIYIPFIVKEIADLRFLSLCWRSFVPVRPEDIPKTTLILSVDQQLSDGLKNEIVPWFENLGFADIRLFEARIPDDEAIYVRGMDKSRIGPKYGLKSGPNLHFFFNQRQVSGKFRYALHYEVDMVPTCKFWFSEMRAALPTKFLISGPIYRGPSTLGYRGMLHVNGNAFYGASHDLHHAWVDMLDTYIADCVSSGDVGITFDVATSRILMEYMNSAASALYEKGSLGITDEDQLRSLAAAIHYNNEILNAAGKHENETHYPLSFEDHISRYCPGARLVHGRRFRFMALPAVLNNSGSLTADEKQFLWAYVRDEISKPGVEAFRNAILLNNRELLTSLRDSYLSSLLGGTTEGFNH
jgi:hypothetical protein